MKKLSTVLGSDDFIQEGTSPAEGVVLLACTVGESYNSPKNRMLILRDGSWLEFPSSGESVLGIDAFSDGAAFVLGDNGSVIEFDWRCKDGAELLASIELHSNASVDALGPMRQIRILGEDVLCAGSMGQVYNLRHGKFKALPRLQIDGEDVTIEDVGGSSARSFIAVTVTGFAASFNGKVWQKIDLPTNAGLNNITLTRDGRYVIAGNSSTLLIGTPKKWYAVPPIDADRDYYGVAVLDERIYAAHIEGIDSYDGKKLKPVPTGKGKSLEFGKVRLGPEGVWSFRGHTVGLLNSTGWHQLK